MKKNVINVYTSFCATCMSGPAILTDAGTLLWTSALLSTPLTQTFSTRSSTSPQYQPPPACGSPASSLVGNSRWGWEASSSDQEPWTRQLSQGVFSPHYSSLCTLMTAPAPSMKLRQFADKTTIIGQDMDDLGNRSARPLVQSELLLTQYYWVKPLDFRRTPPALIMIL